VSDGREGVSGSLHPWDPIRSVRGPPLLPGPETMRNPVRMHAGATGNRMAVRPSAHALAGPSRQLPRPHPEECL